MLEVKHPLYQEDLSMTGPYIKAMVNGKDNVSILVIGATGLIGSFLVDALLNYNDKVVDCITVYAMGRSMERLKKRFAYSSSDRLVLVQHDIQSSLDESYEYDYIFHLASNADPGSYALYPVETISTNILGSMNVIEYAKVHKSTKVVFTSTMEVYGEIEKDKLSEEDYGKINYNQIRAGYPESKRTSELLYRSAVKQYGVNAVIARLGYIYGPTMTDSDNKVVAEFIRNAVNKQDIVLKSEGKQRRTYCYVADTVNGLFVLADKGENGEAYNVADKNSKITIKELAELIAKESRVQLYQDISYVQKNVKVFHTVLCTDKIEKLGCKTRVSIINGINRTIDIYKTE